MPFKGCALNPGPQRHSSEAPPPTLPGRALEVQARSSTAPGYVTGMHRSGWWGQQTDGDPVCPSTPRIESRRASWQVSRVELRPPYTRVLRSSPRDLGRVLSWE